MKTEQPAEASPAKSRAHGSKYDAILRAAQTEFLASGYSRTSMEAIRQRAGVSKATLYTHYADKEALFAAVIRETFQVIRLGESPESVGQLRPQSRAELRVVLLGFANRMMQMMFQSAPLAMLRIVIGELPHFPHLLEIFHRNGPSHGLMIAQGFFTSLRETGLLIPVDGEIMARTFMGPFISYVVTDALLLGVPLGPPAAARLEAHVELFLRAVCVVDA